MYVSSGSQRAGRRSASRTGPMHEINVTPFVDVMLVLLIVFMVTAPLLTAGIPVDLPITQAEAMSEDREPLTVTVQADGTVFLQEEVIQLDELTPKLLAITDSGYDERIYIRGDKTLDYGSVIEVMSMINSAGFRRVALITEPESNF